MKKSNPKGKRNYGREKKTDGNNEDEEAKTFMEKQISTNNEDKINVLENSVSAIKSISLGLSNQLE